MEVDIKAWRMDHNEGEGIAAPELSSDGRQAASRDPGEFPPLLENVMEKCKALSDYSTANLVFSTVTKQLRKLGCPIELIDDYDDQLADYFRMRNEDKSLLTFFCDNHGTVNNKP